MNKKINLIDVNIWEIYKQIKINIPLVTQLTHTTSSVSLLRSYYLKLTSFSTIVLCQHFFLQGSIL